MKNMNNNDMNIELLKAMRGVWIIEIESLEKKLERLNASNENYDALMTSTKSTICTLNRCLNDLIAIIGE